MGIDTNFPAHGLLCVLCYAMLYSNFSRLLRPMMHARVALRQNK